MVPPSSDLPTAAARRQRLIVLGNVQVVGRMIAPLNERIRDEGSRLRDRVRDHSRMTVGVRPEAVAGIRF
jgi:hypothetical protein